MKIFKLEDLIKLINCALAFNHFKKLLPTSFDEYLQTVLNVHSYNTKSSKLKYNIKSKNTISYGSYSIATRTTSTWNNIIPKINVNLQSWTKIFFNNPV